MNQLTPIEKNNQRVLTTQQLSEIFQTETKVLNRNYQRNNDRYKEGKHYFSLTGEELKDFKGSRQFDDSLKYTSVLYLWTQKGVWLHAKSLNNDIAWDAYEKLIDDYFEIKTNQIDLSQLSPELQFMNSVVQQMNKQALENKQTKELALKANKEIKNISNIVSISNVDWRDKVNSILKKVAQKWSGIEPYRSVKNLSYERVEKRAGCNLNVRLNNRKERAIAKGMTKSYVKNINKLDVIAEEKRLVEIYLQVVKEMAIEFRVDMSDSEEVI